MSTLLRRMEVPVDKYVMCLSQNEKHNNIYCFSKNLDLRLNAHRIEQMLEFSIREKIGMNLIVKVSGPMPLNKLMIRIKV